MLRLIIPIVAAWAVCAPAASLAQEPASDGGAVTSAPPLELYDAEAEQPLGDDGGGLDTGADSELDDLLNQDLTQLRSTSVAPNFDVEVSSVARQKSTIGRTPAAVFVISQEMIERSGARSLPEVLRLAPGLHVARIDGNKWSITSRGFGGRFANKLLVQIDGRTVYSPFYAGVHWDVQDLLLEDIERIEVIRGPGATVWGANAVNGVINVITKSAADTHGAYVIAGGGNVEQGFTGARVGGQSAAGVNWRASAKWYQRDDLYDPSGQANDATELAHASFRNDWQASDVDLLTLQGDYYKGSSGTANVMPFGAIEQSSTPVAGGNLLGRWTQTQGPDAESSLQVYYDRTDRTEIGLSQETNTFDIDFQDRFQLNARNSLIWGLGYRRVWDNNQNDDPLPVVDVHPERMTTESFSGFIQDQYTIAEDLAYLTFGTKISHDTFADWQVQPSIRLLGLPSESQAVWASVSRAVRTPPRALRTAEVLVGEIPPPAPPGLPLILRGSDSSAIEKLMAYEVGYRSQPLEWFSWDLALFYNVYEDYEASRLRTPAPPELPYIDLYEGGSAHAYGFELYSQLDLTSTWSLRGWYSFLRIAFDSDSEALGSSAEIEGESPRNQVHLMSSWDLPRNWQLDAIGRYVDSLPALGVDSYITMDLRAAWRPRRDLELTVVAQNLLDRNHAEYASNAYTREIATEVPRGIYGMIEWMY